MRYRPLVWAAFRFAVSYPVPAQNQADKPATSSPAIESSSVNGRDSKPPATSHADTYAALDDECWQLYNKHDNSREAGVACQKAADYLDEFVPETEIHEKLSEYLAAAWALANSGEALAARPYAEKAVRASSKTLDYTFGIGSAYAIRGIIEGNLHELDASDRDLTQAEQFGRQAYKQAVADHFKGTEMYKLYLVNYLRAHSALLIALHRDKEAKERLDEAISLQ